MENNKKSSIKREMTLGESLLVIFFLVSILSFSMIVLKADPQIPFIFALIVTAAMAKRVGVGWDELEKSILSSINSVMQAVIILILVGLVIGAWIQGGIVPSLIYYGLKIINPKYFLVTIYLVCCAVSTATGTSWTTVGTLGVAAMGMSAGLGIPLPITAGTVVAASYLGDKISPLSDTANLHAAIMKVSIFDHVKHMMWTTIPSFLICLVMYAILGLRYASTSSVGLEQVAIINETLQETFLIHPLLMLPVLMVVLMVVFKFKAIPGIMVMALIGSICALAFQGSNLTEAVSALHYGFSANTGVVIVDELLTRGGLDSMMWTVSLILVAMAYGGVLDASGALRTIVNYMLKFIKREGSLIMSSVVSCIILNIIAVDNYVAALITGSMFEDAYTKFGLHRLNLSRVLADGAGITSPLIPWNTCGIVMFGMLGISAWEYAPYAFLSWVTPIVTIIFGYLGTGTKRIVGTTELTAEAVAD